MNRPTQRGRGPAENAEAGTEKGVGVAGRTKGQQKKNEALLSIDFVVNLI